MCNSRKIGIVLLAVVVLLTMSGSVFAMDHTIELLDFDGDPIVGYEVYVWYWDGNSWEYYLGVTGWDGRFTINFVPLLGETEWVAEAHDDRFKSMNGSAFVFYPDGFHSFREEW